MFLKTIAVLVFYSETEPDVRPQRSPPLLLFRNSRPDISVAYMLLRFVGLSVKQNPTMDALLRAAALLLLGLLCSSLPPTLSYRVHIPPHDQVARVARFVAHQCDWASMATISTHKPVVGQPFSNVFSVSDGPLGSGSGVPYMYLTRMEISVQDLQVKPRLLLYLECL